jgi:hypothetical protein
LLRVNSYLSIKRINFCSKSNSQLLAGTKKTVIEKEISTFAKVPKQKFQIKEKPIHDYKWHKKHQKH